MMMVIPHSIFPKGATTAASVRPQGIDYLTTWSQLLNCISSTQPGESRMVTTKVVGGGEQLCRVPAEQAYWTPLYGADDDDDANVMGYLFTVVVAVDLPSAALSELHGSGRDFPGLVAAARTISENASLFPGCDVLEVLGVDTPRTVTTNVEKWLQPGPLRGQAHRFIQQYDRYYHFMSMKLRGKNPTTIRHEHFVRDAERKVETCMQELDGARRKYSSGAEDQVQGAAPAGNRDDAPARVNMDKLEAAVRRAEGQLQCAQADLDCKRALYNSHCIASEVTDTSKHTASRTGFADAMASARSGSASATTRLLDLAHYLTPLSFGKAAATYIGNSITPQSLRNKDDDVLDVQGMLAFHPHVAVQVMRREGLSPQPGRRATMAYFRHPDLVGAEVGEDPAYDAAMTDEGEAPLGNGGGERNRARIESDPIVGIVPWSGTIIPRELRKVALRLDHSNLRASLAWTVLPGVTTHIFSGYEEELLEKYPANVEVSDGVTTIQRFVADPAGGHHTDEEGEGEDDEEEEADIDVPGLYVKVRGGGWASLTRRDVRYSREHWRPMWAASMTIINAMFGEQGATAHYAGRMLNAGVVVRATTTAVMESIDHAISATERDRLSTFARSLETGGPIAEDMESRLRFASSKVVEAELYESDEHIAHLGEAYGALRDIPDDGEVGSQIARARNLINIARNDWNGDSGVACRKECVRLIGLCIDDLDHTDNVPWASPTGDAPRHAHRGMSLDEGNDLTNPFVRFGEDGARAATRKDVYDAACMFHATDLTIPVILCATRALHKGVKKSVRMTATDTLEAVVASIINVGNPDFAHVRRAFAVLRDRVTAAESTDWNLGPFARPIDSTAATWSPWMSFRAYLMAGFERHGGFKFQHRFTADAIFRVMAAGASATPLPNVILVGPPGSGKTDVAKLATLMVNVKTQGPNTGTDGFVTSKDVTLSSHVIYMFDDGDLGDDTRGSAVEKGEERRLQRLLTGQSESRRRQGKDGEMQSMGGMVLMQMMAACNPRWYRKSTLSVATPFNNAVTDRVDVIHMTGEQRYNNEQCNVNATHIKIGQLIDCIHCTTLKDIGQENPFNQMVTRTHYLAAMVDAFHAIATCLPWTTSDTIVSDFIKRFREGLKPNNTYVGARISYQPGAIAEARWQTRVRTIARVLAYIDASHEVRKVASHNPEVTMATAILTCLPVIVLPEHAAMAISMCGETIYPIPAMSMFTNVAHAFNNLATRYHEKLGEGASVTTDIYTPRRYTSYGDRVAVDFAPPVFMDQIMPRARRVVALANPSGNAFKNWPLSAWVVFKRDDMDSLHRDIDDDDYELADTDQPEGWVNNGTTEQKKPPTTSRCVFTYKLMQWAGAGASKVEQHAVADCLRRWGKQAFSASDILAESIEHDNANQDFRKALANCWAAWSGANEAGDPPHFLTDKTVTICGDIRIAKMLKENEAWQYILKMHGRNVTSMRLTEGSRDTTGTATRVHLRFVRRAMVENPLKEIDTIHAVIRNTAMQFGGRRAFPRGMMTSGIRRSATMRWSLFHIPRYENLPDGGEHAFRETMHRHIAMDALERAYRCVPRDPADIISQFTAAHGKTAMGNALAKQVTQAVNEQQTAERRERQFKARQRREITRRHREMLEAEENRRRKSPLEAVDMATD